ncbi:helix-turn-helix domain-containing protein [Ruicaihuangia caeni]|uniref:helix-turn-helix domain-containing protein n=1 Tax=Ruicaihuangia caeni TaxID=3042517 RepID=UPI003BF47042
MVLKIVAGQLTVADAAVEYGISRRHLHRLLARYREGGLDAVEPRSLRPVSMNRPGFSGGRVLPEPTGSGS